MLVLNTENRIHLIDAVTYVDAPDGKGRLRSASYEIRLMPGVNHIDDVAWAAAKENWIVRGLVEGETFKEQPEADDISAMAPKRAQEIIGQTVDRELLESWAQTEKRPAVASAIRKQIKAITFEPSEK